MPTYEYSCRNCQHVTQIFHSIKEQPTISCESCGSTDVERLISPPCFIVRNTQAKIKSKDKQQRRADMKADLAENYGVEEMRPFGTGPNALESAYNDVKMQGNLVKDQMQAKAEINEKKRQAKRREWKRKALRRTKQRAAEKKEMKAKEAAEKRRINLS